MRLGAESQISRYRFGGRGEIFFADYKTKHFALVDVMRCSEINLTEILEE